MLDFVLTTTEPWLPSLEEILGKAGHAKIMSKIDLAKRIPQDTNESRDLTTFICPFGKYRYTKMPFGLRMHLLHSRQQWLRFFKGVSLLQFITVYP